MTSAQRHTAHNLRNVGPIRLAYTAVPERSLNWRVTSLHPNKNRTRSCAGCFDSPHRVYDDAVRERERSRDGLSCSGLEEFRSRRDALPWIRFVATALYR